MRELLRPILLAAAAATLLLGCGVADDFEAGSRLRILRIADENDNAAPIFLAVEGTDDSGKDGELGTFDEGENDGFPDQEETRIEGEELKPDLGVLTLANEPRAGVDPGVPLQVFRVDVTYLDANGATRSFAPAVSQSRTLTLAPGESGDLEFELVSLPMKETAGGLRDIFLYGSESEVAAVSTMTAIVDVYAVDVDNDDTVHAQGRVNISFVNATKSGLPDQ